MSYWQNDINWKDIKESGLDFAIIRIGRTRILSDPDGISIKEDDRFKENITEALEAGIDVGVYFYSRAVSIEEVDDEADFIIDQLTGYQVTYPVVIEWMFDNELPKTKPIG